MIPIVMAMVAGVFLRFDLDLVYALRDEFRTAAPIYVSLFHIGAPFWRLVIGYLCSKLLEPGDFPILHERD